MHVGNQICVNWRELPGQEFERSDFHAVLLAMAGHDLRQHLQVILDTCLWLSARITNAPTRKRIERSEHAVARMAELLRQLTNTLHMHQRTGRIDMAPVGLGPLLSTLGQDATELALQQRVRLSVVPTRAVVLSDPVLLESAVGNLLQNALKSTGPGGRVLLGCRRCGPVVRIEVHDTGIGIPSSRLEEIFEPFHRLCPTQSGGLGLGLFIVSRAVELLQHQIEVQSAVGRGSRFTILARLSNDR